MAIKRNKKLAVARRRAEVADLYLSGWRQVDIAKKLGVSQATVSSDLQALEKEWTESAVRDFDLARGCELYKLQRVEREAWKGWERSQEPEQEARVRDRDGATEKRVKTRDGDPRFLDAARKCIADRRALLGLDAPSRVHIRTEHHSLDERRQRVLAIMAELPEVGADARRQASGPRLQDASVTDEEAPD